MQFTTPIEISHLASYGFEDSFLLVGSCFTANIGRRMKQSFLQTAENPFGELYNPLSVAECLRWIKSDRLFEASDLIYHNGLYHSMLHHGSFSMPTQQETLDKINNQLLQARNLVSKAKRLHLIITFGSAFVYERENKVVGNCHKLPDNEFNVRRLTVDEIVAEWKPIIKEWSNADFIFTVSPIRHKKYGMHGNQLSKATLLLAVEQLGATYFPAYELMLDELRDYRFYADDMLHPSEQAVYYIWQQFQKTCFTAAAQQQIAEAADTYRLINHRVLHEGTPQAQQLESQKRQKINNLKQKYPWIEKF